MKQVWVNLATCSATRAATLGAALPTETTAIPAPKSMRELPSASTMTPPPASVTNTGSTMLTPRATARSRLASSSREAGPGISVTRLRRWGRRGAAAACWVMFQTIDHQAGRLKCGPAGARDGGNGAEGGGYRVSRGFGAGVARTPITGTGAV